MRGIVPGAIIALFCATARFGTPQTGSQKVLDNGTQVLNAKVYGAVCDGGSHPLSGYYATLAAAQAVYPFVTSLTQQIDYAALKQGTDVAFGPDGREHGGNTALNIPLYVPAGTCNLGSDELLIRNADGISFNGAGKTATIFEGSNVNGVIGFDGLWYSSISNFEVVQQNASATVAMDVDGNVPGHLYGTRSVQGNIFQNLLVNGGNGTYALAFCRLGGNAAQCSEDMMINIHLGNASNAVMFLNGFNALDNVWIGGDVQGYSKDGIFLQNSTLREVGISFEPTPGCAQLNNGGYDIHATGGVGGTIVSIGSRTEGFSFLRNSSINAVLSGFQQNAALSTWTANAPVILAEAVEKTGSDGKPHLYCATTAGTAGATAPTWPATGAVTDGTAIWMTTVFNVINAASAISTDPSDSFDPAALITTAPMFTYFGGPNNAGGFFQGILVGGTTSEIYLQSQASGISLYANPQRTVEPSAFTPLWTLPANSVGVATRSINGFTVATPLKPTMAVTTVSGAPTITGCGTISSQVGGGLAGTFVTSATSCTPALTGLPAASHGYACLLWDQTTPTAPIGNLSSTTTSATFGTLTTTAFDTLAFQCGLSY
jgi:hypothetical protein